MATVLTRNQYENQFVDFYEQTLGTGISVVDPIEDDDDDTQDDGTTRSGTLTGVMGVGGEDAFNPMAGTSITGGPLKPQAYNAMNISAGQYVRDNAKSAKKSMDKSDSGFSSYMKNLTTEQFKKRPGEVAILGAASIATGLPLTVVGAVAGDLNRRKQFENATLISATGGGNMMNLNGQTVSRAPGSNQYTGTLGNFTSKQIYAIEELGKGYIPGTMQETFFGQMGDYDDESSEGGGYTVTGKEGLLDAATAERLGGNYDAYGMWHSTKYGTVSRGAPIKAAEELAKQLGVYTPNMDTAALVKFSNTWKDAAKPQTTTQGTFKDFLSGLFSNPLRDSTIDEYKTQRDKVLANIRGYDSDEQDDDSQPDGTNVSNQFSQKVEEQGTRDFFDDVYEDDESDGGFSPGGTGAGRSDYQGGGTSFDSGSSPSYSGGSMSDFGDYGSYEFATGGRIGMQAGGTAPVGFVQGPPGQFSEAETVADDQPMEVPEGTFVINAPAVEHAGSQDIRKMILDAYTVAREKGLDIGRVDRKLYEESVDVALSKGEVVIPPQIAKIIGYDRLRKINNRGKKEVSRRQKASEGGFLGLAEGGAAEDPFNYEDPIILDEVNKGMQALLDEYAKRGVRINTEPFDTSLSDVEVRESQERARQINGEYISGNYTGDPLPEGGGRPYVNVPRTPSLLNFFILAEELHHLDAYKDSNQVVSPYDTSPMATVEMRYAEELRAKQKAYETVKGLLPKGKRTKEFTEDNYAKTFLFFLKQATPENRYQKILADMTKKYPELARVSKQDKKAGMAEGGVPTPTRKPKKEQLADIEFRADMEIFIQNDPLARLGYKLYEDRNLRFNAFVANPPKYDKDGELIGGTRNTAGGAFYPAQGVRRDKSDDPRRTRPAPESVFAKGVKRQGVKSPIEDSIPHMFLVAGESITQDRFQSYITAAHELRHAALDYLSKKYDFDLESISVEEQMMDYADLMAREKAAKLNPNVSKIFKLKDTQYKKESSSSIPEIKRKYDLYSGLAEKMLKEEGYPAQTPAMEPEGFLTRTYKSLVN
tara:strand:+ start:4776 stop:7910 length:3135 start_codon:yes stop_codon:yes gene_type:complete